MQSSDTHVSRSSLRDAIRADLDVALKDALQPADLSFDGVPVLTEPALVKVLNEVFTAPLSAPDERHAEVSTNATVVVHLICPRCGFSAQAIVYIGAELVVDDAHGELRVKTKSKARTHVCGQAELPVADDQVEGQTTIADLLGDDETEAPEESGPSPDEKLDRHLREVEETTETTTETVTEEVIEDDKDPGTCPYPRCARAIDHRGLHRDADGKKLTNTEEGPEA